MTIAFVPIRSGSKSIKDKNIKLLRNKPLAYWVIKALSEASLVEEVVVATDSDLYQQIINSFNLEKVVVYKREALNATDISSTESVMLEYLSKTSLPDDKFFILAQVTSPFTTSKDVNEAIQELKKTKADSLLTCTRTKRFFWNDAGEPINYDYKNRPRRQDYDGLLIENGALYINTIGNIKKSQNRLSGKVCIYEMPEYTSLEIDEELDWQIAESLMRKYLNE